MRSLAEFVDETRADVLAVCEIDSGDAYALATRFALQWAYRGAQALFWNGTFVAYTVRDLYLPFSPLRPFDRRGLLSVAGALGAQPACLFTTQFASERFVRIPEVRAARMELRTEKRALLAFAQFDAGRTGLDAFGAVEIARDERDGLRAYARGFTAELIDVRKPQGGIGGALRLRAELAATTGKDA